MITEDYVSFETAKLLKEKGFDSECHSHYYPCHYPDGSIKYERDKGAQRGTKTSYNVYSLKNIPKDHYLAPTLQMVKKWLRKEHNLFVEIHYATSFLIQPHTTIYFQIYYMSLDYTTSGKNMLPDDYIRKYYTSYEEACEAAIKYCLENLI